MKDKLDKIFSEYEEKKRSIREEITDKKQKHEEFRIKAMKVFNEVIIPVLNDISTDLNNRGHESSVSSNNEHASYPSARLKFKLTSKDLDFFSATSILSFTTTTYNSNIIEISKDFKSPNTNGDDAFGILDRKNSKPFEDVTSGWVKDQAISFVESVLSKY